MLATFHCLDGADFSTDRKIVVIVGTDTDFTVIPIFQSSSDIDIRMFCRRNPLQLYSIGELQSVIGDMKQHLMFVHAINGCDNILSLQWTNMQQYSRISGWSRFGS